MNQVLAALCVIFIAVSCVAQDYGGEEPDTITSQYFTEPENDGTDVAVGRENTAINDRPYIMSMKMKPHWYSKYVHCEAAVVGDHWAMTSARCCVRNCGTPYDPAKLCIRSGTAQMDSNTPEHKVDRVIVMDGYKVDGMENNMCLLKFKTDFNFGASLKALALAGLDAYTGGAFGKITGWSKQGGESSNPLMTATMPLITNERCKELWGNANAITDNMVCVVTPETNTCHGCAGSPLVVDGQLAGIATRGHGCANKPGVFTKVGAYRNWALQHMGIDPTEVDIDVRRG